MAADAPARAPAVESGRRAQAAEPRRNLLQRLKSETAQAHARIEAEFDLDARTRSLDAYRALLAGLYGFHAPFEERAGAALPVLLLDRRKTPLLAADLRALGVADDAIADLPRCDVARLTASVPDTLGAMYVLEGSTLGGAVIARHVERRLGLGRETGCSFFGCYGNSVAPMWKAFGAQLIALAASHDADAIIAAADRTFDLMRLWLTSHDAAPQALSAAEA